MNHQLDQLKQAALDETLERIHPMKKKISVEMNDFTLVYKWLKAVGATENGSSCGKHGIDSGLEGHLGPG